MPNLAGYDLLIEVARMALERELLNTPISTDGSGAPNDTLVPPFMLNRNIPLPGASGLLSLKITDLKLVAQPRSALLTLHLAFEEGALTAPGYDVGMLAGQGDLTAPLYFTPPAPPAPGAKPVSTLVLDFNQATSNLALDPASSARLDQAVGPMMGGAIRSALNTALTTLFKSQGVVSLKFSVAVDPSQDSTSMLILTAAPQVSWIDGETLGIFGYHRKAANTGNPAWKITSDLPPAPYPSFPWYPIAMLLSPSSFQQLVACPAVRAAARDHVSGRHRNDYIDQERNNDHNPGPATPAEIAAADDRLNKYLSSPEGLSETDGCYPAPCGNGQLDQRIKMPNPFPDTTGYINWISMDLGDGRVDLKAKAHAHVFCGSVAVEVPMSFTPSIGPKNTIQPGPIAKGNPNSEVDADFLCEAAIAAMSSFLVGPFIGSVIALLGVAVAESLAEGLVNSEILKQNLPTPNAAGAAPSLPSGVKLKSLQVAPTGLTIQGVWEGMLNDPHKFDPSIHLYWKPSYAASHTVIPQSGTFQAACGGEPRTFSYHANPWDTTIVYTLDIGDVPRPLHFEPWYLWNDGVAHQLIPGALSFPGVVMAPEPPDKETAQSRDPIVIGVQGSDDQGYTLTFRAEDLNVPFEVDTRVVDGSGRAWYLGTNYQETPGLTFSFEQDYLDFRGECAKWINGVVSHYTLVHDVPVWDKVTSFEQVMQEGLRNAVHGQELGVAATLRQVMVDQPEIAQNLFIQQ